ncbi:3-hydroxyacyl-CoA dehydrogenase family protein [Bacillus luteolus]|uniref:3-hydroxyacyl-CoA dehydrogenase family protein n=1 Tax=Litchfieldia luteola TaxID=682179 RepID=A0ABR9QGU5_9BACI|nr:3-hydroxyacyl-CoA dehydrogenase family protein [Cytobacillus luteolus]MBE4907701.1 3-hydroxyacyl-CoA dehydrogenase family protein [Cytobacillus luteolus]MBP1944050.1 3-hydroxybutyryl-CoA dehydrogenase [Cytobacillus luteolus]
MSHQTICVLGSGTMGHGIGQVFAAASFPVVIYDINEQVLQLAKTRIHTNLKLMVEENYISEIEIDRIESNLTYSTDLIHAVSGASLIIEAVPEIIELKKELYEKLEFIIGENTIVASNTSTYSIERLAEGVSFADRMLVVHFFNPAHLVRLVEVVPSKQTKAEVIEQVIEFLSACGKNAVRLQKDIPGFIANRLQAAVVREAMYLLEQGIADARAIDSVIADGPGMRWAFDGPIQIADFGGLDIWEKVTGNLFPELDARTTAPSSISEKVQSNKLGAKSGEGFYQYDREEVTLAAKERDRKLIKLLAIKETE